MKSYKTEMEEYLERVDVEIRDALSKGDLTIPAIAKTVGVAYATAKKHLNQLIERGDVRERRVEHLRFYSLVHGTEEEK